MVYRMFGRQNLPIFLLFVLLPLCTALPFDDNNSPIQIDAQVINLPLQFRNDDPSSKSKRDVDSGRMKVINAAYLVGRMKVGSPGKHFNWSFAFLLGNMYAVKGHFWMLDSIFCSFLICF